MFKLFKFVIAFWAIFVVFAVVSDGGKPIRSIETDTQIILSKTLNAMANQADSIKNQADSAKESLFNRKTDQKEEEQPAPVRVAKKKR